MRTSVLCQNHIVADSTSPSHFVEVRSGLADKFRRAFLGDLSFPTPNPSQTTRVTMKRAVLVTIALFLAYTSAFVVVAPLMITTSPSVANIRTSEPAMSALSWIAAAPTLLCRDGCGDHFSSASGVRRRARGVSSGGTRAAPGCHCRRKRRRRWTSPGTRSLPCWTAALAITDVATSVLGSAGRQSEHRKVA